MLNLYLRASIQKLMEYRRLGKAGLQVSALSLGSWLTFGKQIEDGVAKSLMAKAYEAGVNFFDNAEIYSRGESERVMGKLLKGFGWDRTSYSVSSKLYFGDGGQLPNQTGLSRKHLVEGLDKALHRFQMDYIDLLFCHRPDKNTPIEETVWSMHNFIQQGKILYWGTSEWSSQEITEAHAVANRYNLIGPSMEQPQYNMLHRERFEIEYDQLYKNFGMGTTIWSPLCSGLLSGKYKSVEDMQDTRLTMEGLDWLRERTMNQERLDAVERLKPIAKELGISMPRLAIAWCLKNPNVSTVILGASKLHQLEETLEAINDVELLTDEVSELIEEKLDNKPEHPTW